MQGPGSLPRASPENTKTTQQPLLGPALRTKRQQAAGGLSNKVRRSLYLHAHCSIPPAPGATCRKRALTRVREADPLE